MFSLGVHCVLGANKNETAVQLQLQQRAPTTTTTTTPNTLTYHCMLLYWLNNRGLRAWWKQFCLCECWSQKSNRNALALASLEDLVEQKQHSDIINNCLL